MSVEIKFGLFSLIAGLISLYFAIKSIREYKKENYNPFNEKKSVIKPSMYFQSYAIFVFGILLVLISLVFLFVE